jgi:GTP-binding protein HflX
VGILVPGSNVDLRNPLGELALLTESAGARVVDAMIQKRQHLTTNYALGRGKVGEVKERAEANEADVIIFDNDLSPRQIKNLEIALDMKVIDRSELILDIFASRAKTREAQLQVELAQLQYTAPRIRGMWTHLERLAGAGGGTAAGSVGGVGTRGPGERQIEIDRRIVRERISLLRREIAEVDKRKQQEVRSRGDEYTVSLVGYTNSGKSTLMKSLTGVDVYTADLLFATLDTKTVKWELREGRYALLSDTVGFVRDLPHHLVASFRATLEEAIHAHLLLHVVDGSSPRAVQEIEAVNEVLENLGCKDTPQLLIVNKCDLGVHAELEAWLAARQPSHVRISALQHQGLEALTDTVLGTIHGGAMALTVAVPHAMGKVLAEFDRWAEVLARRYSETAVELDIRINRKQFEQLRGRYPGFTVLAGDTTPPDDHDLKGVV